MNNELDFIKIIIQIKLGGKLGFDRFEELVETVTEGDKKIREYFSKGYAYQWGKSTGRAKRDYYPPHQIEKAELILEYKKEEK